MNIQETGIRGYLKWLKQDQPAIYKSIAAHIVTQAPDAFSNLEQSRAMGSLMGSTSDGWHSGPDWSDRPGSYYRWSNPAVLANPYGNIPAGLGAYTSGNEPNGFGSLGDDSDVASAANTGSSSASVTSIIGNLVSAASQVFLAKNQSDILKQVNQIQLQRAQMGLSPLDVSSVNLGVPQLQVGLNKQTLTGGGIALGIAALLGLAFLMKSGGSSGRARA